MAHHRVQHFRCGQTKAQAFPNRSRPAADFAFIQLNPADWLNFLVVDVDREDALMCLMHPGVPQPTWIIENEVTGHAQAGWAIEPVYRGDGARPHPIRYAAAVQRSLDRLVDGDPCFTRYLVRNPAADRPAGRVWWGTRETPWPLGALKAHMAEWIDPLHDEALDGPTAGAWNPGPEFTVEAGIPRAPVTDTATEVGRNNALFRATRRWLWDQWETRGHAPTNTASIAHAQVLNAQLPAPLPVAELECLARSAVRQVNAGKGRPTRTSSSDAAHEYLSRMGRRGGRARTEAKVAAAKDNVAAARKARSTQTQRLRAQAAQLRAAGATYEAIAAVVGRTARTVMNWLKDITTPVATTVSEGEIVQATGIPPATPGPPEEAHPPETPPASASWANPNAAPKTAMCPLTIPRLPVVSTFPSSRPNVSSPVHVFYCGAMRHPVPLTIDRPVLVSAVLVRVPAGFPSPAQDSFDDGRIDLNEVLIRDVTSTYAFRVTGDSMEGAGIYHGDEILVDRSITPKHGDVVIAVYDDEFTVKRLHVHDYGVVLHPENPAYPDITIPSMTELQVWGVVTYAIHHVHSRKLH